MKISEMSPEGKFFSFMRIDGHDKKLSADNHSAIEAGINYLFLINAGGAVAALSFIGSQSGEGRSWGPLAALGFYVFGLFLVGIVKVFRFSYFSAVAHDWSANSVLFYDDKISFEELVERHGLRRREPLWPYCVGYFSFFCFVGGSLVGFCLLLVATR